MEYFINFKNKQVKRKNLRESKEILENRFQTYFSYLTYRRSETECKGKQVKQTCRDRLQEMEYSSFFDNEFVKYLNTKKTEELPFK